MQSYTTSAFEPTIRSRTLLFLSYRDSRTRSTRFSRPRHRPAYDDLDPLDDEHQGLISSPSHVAVDVNELPPQWWRLPSTFPVSGLV